MKRANFLRKQIVTLGIALTLIFSAMPAQAATLEEAPASESTASDVVEEGTVSQAKKEYTVVTDKAQLLSATQIQTIEQKVAELTNYDVALYIENADQKTCTQKYTNNLSEEMYQKVFGDYRNGIMIVFSFYKPENGYFAVHYGGNVNISESKVSRLIEGSYHDFKTDSTWIEGSFLQCIDYFKTVENEPVKTEEGEESEPWPIAARVISILFVIALFVIAGLAYYYIELKREKKYIEDRYQEVRDHLSEESNEVSRLRGDIKGMNDKISWLTTWKKDALRARTTIQDEINEMLAKEAASKFDSTYANVSNLEAIVENFDQFDGMMNAYESLSKMAKVYVTLDVQTGSEKRQKTGEQYAQIATKKIEEVCKKSSGSRHDRSMLSDTLGYYNHLPLFVRLMIAQSLVKRLNSAHQDAEAAQKRYKRSQSSSHRSSYGGSSFGGGFRGGGTFGGGFGGGH